jgi:hypothetical protein
MGNILMEYMFGRGRGRVYNKIEQFLINIKPEAMYGQYF